MRAKEALMRFETAAAQLGPSRTDALGLLSSPAPSFACIAKNNLAGHATIHDFLRPKLDGSTMTCHLPRGLDAVTALLVRAIALAVLAIVDALVRADAL